VAFGAAASVARAQQVTQVRVSESESGQPSSVLFPEGVERLYVVFDYVSAQNSRISVEIVAPGGLVVFENEQRYTGDGTSAVEVNGDTVYLTLGEQLMEFADATISDLARAQSQAQTQTYLAQVQSYIGPMQMVAEFLSRLPAEQVGISVAELDDALAELDSLLDEAMRLTADQDAQRKALAGDMEPFAEAVAEQAIALVADGEDATGRPLPPTDSASGDGSAYTISLSVNGSASRDASLWIHGQRGADPSSNNDPTAAATKIAAATQTARNASPTSPSALTVGPTRGSSVTSGTQATAASGRVPTAASGAGAVNPIGGAQPAPTQPAQAGLTGPSDQAQREIMTLGSGTNGPQPGAEATWTVPPPEGEGGELTGPRPDGDAPRDGPDFVVLALGLAVLGAMAVFVRRRFL
jgi:hypothetical protein